MAIYSCNLKSIGRTTHEAGTAGAHIRYIARPDADPVLMSEHMPDDPVEARTWLDQQERASRKNARVIDKIRIALPRELTDTQRYELVHSFMSDLTGDHRIPWYAAIHQTGNDAHNPHVHIAVHDRDLETRKRVLRLSDSTRDRRKAGLPGPKAVEWIRERWECVCNQALMKAGAEAQIDRRTLQAQGIDREPTIHEGPRAQHINDNVKRPASKARVNGCGRVIDYPFIDQGRTRREFNAHIIEINLAKAAQSRHAPTAVWAQFEKEQMGHDRALEERLAAERRERTAELRNTSLQYHARIKRLRGERNLKLRAAARKIREKFDPQRKALQERQRAQRQALKDKQSGLRMRIFAVLDFTGITRRRMEAARKALSKEHRAERVALSEKYHEQRRLVETATKERYREKMNRKHASRIEHLARLKEHHGQLENFADLARQQREAEREHMREVVQGRIDAWRKESAGGAKTIADSDFANAVLKAAQRQTDQRKGKGHDFDRER